MGTYLMIGFFWCMGYTIVQMLVIKNKKEFELAAWILVNFFLWPLGVVLVMATVLNMFKNNTN